MGLSFFRPRIILALLALAAVSGVLLAQYIGRIRLQQVEETVIPGRQAIISEIILAGLADPTRRDEPNPPLRQTPTYTTKDYIALRITTLPEITKPIQMGARLLTDKGAIIELDPPSFTLPPGQSTFCCWQIPEAGTFTVQLFRPEGIITTIPIKIRQASEAATNILRGF